ncbi:MAG: YraN family protein [Gammaproteobacteria bacterium]|jgi:putative endonuclease
MATQEIGRHAEDHAARFLVQQGLELLERNFRCRGGEIDLILRDGEHLVFVEVRLRRNPAFGGPLATVDLRKQRRIILAARHYLARRGNRDACRFDVVGLDGRSEPLWVKDAFPA